MLLFRRRINEAERVYRRQIYEKQDVSYPG
jgi:hypothetical protein